MKTIWDWHIDYICFYIIDNIYFMIQVLWWLWRVCCWLCRWSLLGVIIYRTADGADRQIWRSILLGRSYCDAGRHPLRRYQLIPLISYLWQWTKCIQCRAKIPLKYTIIEIITACSALLIAWIAPSLWIWSALILIWSWLIVIACVDIENQTLHIPSRCVLVLIHLLLIIQDRDIMIIFSGLWTLLIFVLIYRWAKYYAQYKYQMQEWFGQGDVMLAPILMMSLTRYQLQVWVLVTQITIWSDLIYLLLIASIIGLWWYVISWSLRSHQTLAFLPYMILWYVFLMIFERAW